MFLCKWKCKKNISETLQKYYSKGYKESFQMIFCIIAWNVLGKFWQHFGGFNVLKVHFKKCYCQVLQSFPEVFLGNFL